MTAPPLDRPVDVSVDPHRADVEFLLERGLADLAASWAISADPVATRDALAAVLPDLIGLYGPAAATLGADWYDDLRAQTGVSSRFRAIPAELPDAGLVESLAGWGTTPLFVGAPELDENGSVIRQPKLGDPDFVPDLPAAQERVAGGFQKAIADMDRNTIIGSLDRDRDSKGWARRTTGKSCPFCVEIAARGAVYSSRTANFASHNHCDCIAYPVWADDPRPVLPYTPAERFRTQAQRDANNARIRAWLASAPSTPGP